MNEICSHLIIRLLETRSDWLHMLPAAANRRSSRACSREENYKTHATGPVQYQHPKGSRKFQFEIYRYRRHV